MKKIAIFYASEGTGHRAAAYALRDWFLLEEPGGEVLCRDVLDYLPAFAKRLVAGGYLFMARYAPRVWGWFYKSSDRQAFVSVFFDSLHHFICRFYLPKVERDVREFSPESVYFTHYFCALPFAKRNCGHFPTFCVDTDFLTHRFQRGVGFTASFAASDEAVWQREEEGIGNVFRTGIPIAPKFSRGAGKEEARGKLGLEKGRATVLLSGGGIGAGAIEVTLASLAAIDEWQKIVICGNNERLFSRLSRRYASNHSVRVEAFVKNMEDYYGAADIAVMKPGGLSVSEALALGLPLLLMDPIPGQEELNLRWLMRHGVAVELTCGQKAAGVIRNILDDEELIGAMKRSSAEMASPAAGRLVLEISGQIVADRKVTSKSAP